MNHYVFLALLATLGTWSATALGAATVLFFKSTNTKLLNLMLGFSAGVMIAASFWSLLQPALELAESSCTLPAPVMVAGSFIIGALFMWMSDKIVSYMREKITDIPEQSEASDNRVLMLILSITLHNIPEGMAVGVAFP